MRKTEFDEGLKITAAVVNLDINTQRAEMTQYRSKTKDDVLEMRSVNFEQKLQSM